MHNICTWLGLIFRPRFTHQVEGLSPVGPSWNWNFGNIVNCDFILAVNKLSISLVSIRTQLILREICGTINLFMNLSTTQKNKKQTTKQNKKTFYFYLKLENTFKLMRKTMKTNYKFWKLYEKLPNIFVCNVLFLLCFVSCSFALFLFCFLLFWVVVCSICFVLFLSLP